MYEMRDLLQQWLLSVPVWFWVLVAWDCIWKLLALWRAARNTHRVWFVILAFTSTIGLLPIIYLLWSRSPAKRGHKAAKRGRR